MFTKICFTCNQFGRQSFICLEKQGYNYQGGERRVHLAQEEDTQSMNSPSRHANLEQGECLMFQRTLLKVPTTKEQPQRKTLFRTTCKVSGKVCRVIVDSVSTDNLASIVMVIKLGLKKLPHPFPYKVFWLSKEQQALVSEQF